MPKTAVSRRKLLSKKKEEEVSITGVKLEQCWCRKCMQLKKPQEFYSAVDFVLDSNGKMSICKSCIETLFNATLHGELDIYRTFLIVCRILNIKYDELVIDNVMQMKKKLDEKGVNTPFLFGVYKNRLANFAGTGTRQRIATSIDLTFVEPSRFVEANPITDEDDEDVVDVKKRWGTNYTDEDYDYLESELAEWKKTHKCDTKAEITLLQEICHKSLEIRNERTAGRATASKVKELQDLMKTANVDPAKTATAGGGQSKEAFSNFIKIIENEEPADYYTNKELFKDFDNINWYFKKFITRPLGNFLQITKDFNLNENAEEDGSDDLSLDESIFENQEE